MTKNQWKKFKDVIDCIFNAVIPTIILLGSASGGVALILMSRIKTETFHYENCTTKQDDKCVKSVRFLTTETKFYDECN